MILYYPFWMFMGFILHIYIIFGTNLLTGGPARIAVFLPISVFRRKGISNRVQTEWNLRERDVWNKRDPEDLEWKSRSSRGGHEGGGCAPYLVGLSGGHRRTSSSYIYPCTPKTSREPTKNNIWISSEFFYVWLSYLCKSLQIISLVWPTRLIFLAMGEVLSFGFNLAVTLPSDNRGCKARIVLLPSRIKRWDLYHIAWVYPSTSCHLS